MLCTSLGSEIELQAGKFGPGQQSKQQRNAFISRSGLMSLI